nr:secreted trypsin-like serine protease [Kibdelosporangium sp. MJ126-NF4]CTQ89071.1 secreted trypsin-like serine protease [Kibdelosporangium sp. MJ126-NF4]
MGLAAAAVAMLVPATAAASDASGGVQPNVIGGNPPTQNYPAGALVSLKYDAPSYGREAWHTCGATLLDGIHLRTAAHCVTDPPPEASVEKLAGQFQTDAQSLLIPSKDKKFWVRVGSTNKDSGGIVAQVRVKWVHPNWSWATTPGSEVDDIALLEASEYIDAYELPLAPRKAKQGDEVFVLGWGVNRADGVGPVPTLVRELKTTVANPRNCDPAGITAREVCVATVNGTSGSCYGDSGGPLVIKISGVLYDAGITSRAATARCGVTPTVYTSTPEFARELYDVMSGTPATPQAQKPPTAPKMTQPFERPGGAS